MSASEIVRVLDALEIKERVAATGARQWVYLGDPAGIPDVPQIPADDVVRYRRFNAAQSRSACNEQRAG